MSSRDIIVPEILQDSSACAAAVTVKKAAAERASRRIISRFLFGIAPEVRGCCIAPEAARAEPFCQGGLTAT
jgi:hypothetical protein